MKRAPLILQLTALTLLVGLIALIVFSKGLLNGGSGGDPAPARTRGASGLLPDERGRVFYARVGESLFLLAPLDLLSSRVDFDRRWLESVVGEKAREHSFLVLHVFHRGREAPFRFDPAQDRVELSLVSGATFDDLPLAADLAIGATDPAGTPDPEGTPDPGRVQISRSDRLVLRSLVPEAPVELTKFATARFLLRFAAAGVWPVLAGARLRQGDGEILFREVEIPFMAWESVLAGGPVEDATFPPRREAKASDAREPTVVR